MSKRQFLARVGDELIMTGSGYVIYGAIVGPTCTTAFPYVLEDQSDLHGRRINV